MIIVHKISLPAMNDADCARSAAPPNLKAAEASVTLCHVRSHGDAPRPRGDTRHLHPLSRMRFISPAALSLRLGGAALVAVLTPGEVIVATCRAHPIAWPHIKPEPKPTEAGSRSSLRTFGLG